MAVLVFLLCGLLAADASRIKEVMDVSLDADSDNKWYRSCDALQTRFGTGSKRLQELVDSASGSEEMTVVSQVNLVVKASAIMRTLRRSKDCSWVVDGDSDALQAVGKVVRSVLANNPCATAAVAELQHLDDNGEEGTAPVGRAMSILLSDTCEVGEVEHVDDLDNADAIVDPTNLETEELVLDAVDEIMMAESAGMSDSLLEKSEMHRASGLHIVKVIGAIMLGVYLVLYCANSAFWIAGFIGMAFTYLLIGVSVGLTPYMHSIWRANGKLLFAGSLLYMPTFLFASAAYLGGVAVCGNAYLSLVNSTQVLHDDGATNVTGY